MTDTSGVVVTATATELSPDPPDPPVPVKIGGEYRVKHYTATIDFSDAVKTLDSTDIVYTFDYNIRKAIMESDEVNFTNFKWQGLKLWGGLVITHKASDDKLYMFVAGTDKNGFTNAPTEPNVIRWVTDPET